MATTSKALTFYLSDESYRKIVNEAMRATGVEGRPVKCAEIIRKAIAYYLDSDIVRYLDTTKTEPERTPEGEAAFLAELDSLQGQFPARQRPGPPKGRKLGKRKPQ